MIRLFFMNPVRYGGHVTFTRHLMEGLEAIGQPVALYKLHKRSEQFDRDFGYGARYRNVSIEEVSGWDLTHKPILITAPSKPMAQSINDLLDLGARIVIHDPAEFKHGWDMEQAVANCPIVIRKSMIPQVENCTFIKHPYMRRYTNAEAMSNCDKRRRFTGISISRIDFDKHIEWILDANRKLAKRKQIQINGFENRIYTRFNIMPKYPEWVQSEAAYERGFRTAVEMCRRADTMVDMSIIKGDGGGTQYTFLEAMDAGAVPVLHPDWILKRDAMRPGKNCLTAGNGDELAKLMRQVYDDPYDLYDLRMAGFRLLKQHDAKKIAKIYQQELIG